MVREGRGKGGEVVREGKWRGRGSGEGGEVAREGRGKGGEVVREGKW